MTQSQASVSNSSQSGPTQIPECPAGRWWVCALLGAVMLAGSVFVLFNIVLASIATA